ncbi:MAG: YidC/Oxa1 family membrane protein insertase, partial [Acidimicrobiia bacterium]
LTGYLQFKQTQSRQSSQVNPQMAMMGKIFPLMFAFISLSLPSGVVLYFLVSNAWQIGQQAIIYGSMLPQDLPPLAAPSASVTPSKPTPPPPDAEPKKPRFFVRADDADGKVDGEGKGSGGAGAAGGGSARSPESFGRAQPSGSRPRPKRRRR